MFGLHHKHLLVVYLSPELSAGFLDLVHPALEGLPPHILRVPVCVLHVAAGTDQGLHVGGHVTEGLQGAPSGRRVKVRRVHRGVAG